MNTKLIQGKIKAIRQQKPGQCSECETHVTRRQDVAGSVFIQKGRESLHTPWTRGGTQTHIQEVHRATVLPVHKKIFICMIYICEARDGSLE